MSNSRCDKLFYLLTISFIAAVAAGAVGFNGGSCLLAALSQSDYGRTAEVVLLYGMLSWVFICLSISIGTEIGAELAEVDRGSSDTDYQSFYKQESHSKLLILVPSYREERETIWQTLMSAALAEHPARDVVLLIDDPSTPSNEEQERLLRMARVLPIELQRIFDAAADPLDVQLQLFKSRKKNGIDLAGECCQLAALYEKAARWLEFQAEDFLARRSPCLTHTDMLFAAKILQDPARDHRNRAASLRHARCSFEEIAAEYLRLASLFRVRFNSFERKQYVNLSHAPNKAMNLNSYLGLIGGAFIETASASGKLLERCHPAHAIIMIPEYQFVVALDADSLITSDYNVRLVGFMNRPENARFAIAQSPYTAFPDAPTKIERVAAISTDTQYFTHQGSAYLGSCFWVGASALVRYEALREIATHRDERGYRVQVFISDDVLIEDAAATVDLLKKGWKVHHDHRRLSYSATPPDFGSLIIQRRRWANGGLLIVPKLLAFALRWPWSFAKWMDAAMRIPNLTSASTNALFFSIFMLVPFDDSVLPPWMSMVILPWILLTGLNLSRAGYRWWHLPDVLTLSIILAPVNISGTLQSLRQAVTRRSIAFARTPKILNRTRAPKIYVFATYGLILVAGNLAIFEAISGRYAHSAFAAVNCASFLTCLLRYIGFFNSLDDLGIRVPARRGCPALTRDEAPFLPIDAVGIKLASQMA